ncbi:transcription factor bHLH123-like [Diospyros lotus]|uniref:transcription factor bHLH123-like n=1 Tax=Diospyros lotus TaxID=55363 RepID=UPI00224F18CA|nr:transcription factor bHLH123-like [Diospyros lotus]
MADEFQLGNGNWWSTSRNRIETGSSPSSSSLTSASSFGWPAEMDLKARSSMDSVSVSDSSVVFHDAQKLQGTDSAGSGGVLAADPSLQMMGLGLSSQAMDWNPTLLRGGKAESSFHFQDDLSLSTNFQQETGIGPSQDQFKQINRGFSLDQQFGPQIGGAGDGATSSFPVDPAAYGSPSTIIQGLLGSDSHQAQSSFEHRQINYPYQASFGMSSGEHLLPSSWSKFPQFLRTSPPKQQQPHSQLQFSNSTPFWNATAAAMNDVRSSFFQSSQPQFPPPTFDEKPNKNASEVRELGAAVKKNSSESSNKRPRSETSSPLPAFKVRKEKMGDRITALQQLVSPFGKTDTASVLSEAIEYIKFLHEQVNVLSTPYMKSGASVQHQQSSDKSKDPEGPKQDLRSRGLCLVPVSSTLPVTHEATAELWTPTFGGTFR